MTLSSAVSVTMNTSRSFCTLEGLVIADNPVRVHAFDGEQVKGLAGIERIDLAGEMIPQHDGLVLAQILLEVGQRGDLLDEFLALFRPAKVLRLNEDTHPFGGETGFARNRFSFVQDDGFLGLNIHDAVLKREFGELDLLRRGELKRVERGSENEAVGVMRLQSSESLIRFGKAALGEADFAAQSFPFPPFSGVIFELALDAPDPDPQLDRPKEQRCDDE